MRRAAPALLVTFYILKLAVAAGKVITGLPLPVHGLDETIEVNSQPAQNLNGNRHRPCPETNRESAHRCLLPQHSGRNGGARFAQASKEYVGVCWGGGLGGPPTTADACRQPAPSACLSSPHQRHDQRRRRRRPHRCRRRRHRRRRHRPSLISPHTCSTQAPGWTWRGR